jgi:hypothetical protein
MVSRTSISFYAIAIPAGLIGTAIGELLGWSYEGVFAAGMLPLAVVMLIFILREPADRSEDAVGIRSQTHPRSASR